MAILLLSLSTFNFPLSTSCAKYTVECDLVLQPRVMISSGSGDKTPAVMARAYVYYIDEKDEQAKSWMPMSWADAEAGLVTHRTTGQVRSHSLVGEQGEDDYIHITLSRSPMVIVVIDPINRFYAWRTFKYDAPLAQVLIPVYFKTYLNEVEKNGEWTVAGEKHETAADE